MDLAHTDTIFRVGQSARLPFIWLALFVILLTITAALHVSFRPRHAKSEYAEERETPTPTDPPKVGARAQDMLILAALHDAGKLTDGEYAVEKAHIIRTGNAGTPGSATAVVSTEAAQDADVHEIEV